MKCDLPIELLSGYLDDELEPTQKTEVETHLKSCVYCRQRFEALKHVDEQVRQFNIEEPSREFYFNLNRRVVDKIRKRPGINIFRLSTVLIPVAVAALMLIILVNAPPPTQLISLDNRVRYSVAEEVSEVKREIDLTVPEITSRERTTAEPSAIGGEYAGKGVVMEKAAEQPAPAPAAAKKAAPETEDGFFTMKDDKDLRSEASRDEIMTATVAQDFDIPQDRIVRAIVDSNGRVLKVATGNTLVPEKDTLLENRLQGQQLAPPTVSGRRMQLFVDLTQTEETTR